MPWWLHTLGGLAVVGLLVLAARRLAGRTVRPEPLLRGLATVVWAWLAVQLCGLLTLVVPVGTAAVGGVGALLLSGLVLWRVPVGPPSRATTVDERRLLITVAVGVAVLAALTLDVPVIGYDGLLYHLALPAAWAPGDALGGLPVMIDGAGALPHTVDGLPVEAYPVGSELAAAWIITVTGSTAAGLLLSPAGLGLLVVAIWTLTRTLGGAPSAAWGAAASTALAIPVVVAAGQASNELVTAALMLCGATLVVDAVAPAWRAGRATTEAQPGATFGEGPPVHGAADGTAEPRDGTIASGGDRRPVALDGPLVGLVGLLVAVGVKTTAACGVLLGLLALWRVRREAWRHVRARPAWFVALGAAILVGGIWMARNLILHGHPAWPLLATSFGDPVPDVIAAVDGRFIDHPRAMLDLAGELYARFAWPVLGLGLLAIVIVARDRPGPRRLLALCGLIGAAAWTVAPATGILSEPGLAVGGVRYLLPAWALLAAAGWSLAGEGFRWPRIVPVLAGVVLAVQAWLAIDVLAVDGDPLHVLPGEHALWALGAGVLALAVVLVVPAVVTLLGRPAVALAGTAGLVVVLLAATPGVWQRHAAAMDEDAPPIPDRPVLTLGAVPAWSLGAHGRPGATVVDDCDALRRGLAAGRTVAIGPVVAPELCELPGDPRRISGFRAWVPAP
ncbi:MAG: hypothetical protein AB7G37_10395 [Solirubrobacteraceae bacterium]